MFPKLHFVHFNSQIPELLELPTLYVQYIMYREHERIKFIEIEIDNGAHLPKVFS